MGMKNHGLMGANFRFICVCLCTPARAIQRESQRPRTTLLFFFAQKNSSSREASMPIAAALSKMSRLRLAS